MPGTAASSLYETWMTQQDDAWSALGPLTDAGYLALGCADAAPSLTAEAALDLATDCPPSTWSPDTLTAIRSIDPAQLSRARLVDYVHAIERQKAHLEAAQVRALALLDRRDDSGFQAVREDLACALQIAPAAAQNRLKAARALVDELPVTLAALHDGNITARHAQVMCDVSWRVDPPVAGLVEAAVVTNCAFSTPAMLAQAARAAVLRLDPDGADRRARRAAADRCVQAQPGEDGMAYLNVYGPAAAVSAACTRIDAAARMLPANDPRTRAQQRFDMFVDGVLTGLPPGGLPLSQGRAPQIQVTVAATTLLGLDDEPGQLAGYGAITAAVARDIAHDRTGTWRRIVADPVSGQVLEYGRTTYRPPQALVDLVSTRDDTCVFPGCRQSARRCDLDHVQPWNRDGTTGISNMAALCRRHHQLKTDRRWSYRLAGNGAIDWISSTGHHYRSRPPATDATTELSKPPKPPKPLDPDPPPF